MSRRLVNLIVSSSIGQYPASTLHRIDPWRCFYPTKAQALAAAADAAANNINKTVITEDARLPRAAISLYAPYRPEDHAHFMSLGRSSNDIVSTDEQGNTFIYDGASRAVGVMPAPHAPKLGPVSLTVGDGLYLLERNPETEEEEDHPFEALIHVHRRPSDGCGYIDEDWYWRSLPPPPYAYKDYEYRKIGDYEEYRRRCSERDGKRPYEIDSYAVVGGSKIWISTTGGGTFSFDTTSGVWSEAGDWALPLYGRVEYAPELGLWFGFTSDSEGGRFAACDLGAASPTKPPELHTVWDELAPPRRLPPRWVHVMAFVLPLNRGKFCVARMFNLAHEGWCREKHGNHYLDVETFVVFTGVEIERGGRGALRMIRHKSRRYSLGDGWTGDLL